jgi:CO/xanthine dehydrogenase Mo-binding subunit
VTTPTASGGVIRNPSFTDYLIPTILEMPPTISSTPAVVAAIRAATGRDLARVPVRPEHIAGGSSPRPSTAGT